MITLTTSSINIFKRNDKQLSRVEQEKSQRNIPMHNRNEQQRKNSRIQIISSSSSKWTVHLGTHPTLELSSTTPHIHISLNVYDGHTHIASYGQRHTHTAHNTHTYPIHVPHNYAYEWVVSIVIGIAISTHTHSQPAAIGISLLLFVAVTFCIHRSNRQIHTKSKKPSRRRKKHCNQLN